MSNQLSVFKSAGLPAVANVANALRTMKVENAGHVIIKMDKTGHWVFGADQTEIESDSQWAINPFSFIHGFIAWGDGDVLGEKMVAINEPLPDLDEAPKGAKKGWESQVGLSMKCTNGEDAGMEARYTTTSVGGKRAVQTLGAAIADQIEKDPSKPVAIVSLKKDHYSHKSYGRIYTPVFEIVGWMGMTEEAAPAAEAEGGDAPEPATEAEAPAETAPTRRRRAAV